jgi:hypothetical protein
LLVAATAAVISMPIDAAPAFAGQTTSLRSSEVTDISANRKKPKKPARKEQYMRAVPAK